MRHNLQATPAAGSRTKINIVVVQHPGRIACELGNLRFYNTRSRTGIQDCRLCFMGNRPCVTGAPRMAADVDSDFDVGQFWVSPALACDMRDGSSP